ncbi:hypothetical protein Daesc_002898 [Daldinia eschscholtzii]|uniref:Uncharacterized protein n=1 Tax=Daldinia eschscholtzii TaxID=292717 RepID=A0AAX6MS92_9PEZI
MAYSHTCNTLAVGLGNLLYGWSEASGVTLLNTGHKDGSWLTSVAFSSERGGKSILAFGRSSGLLSLEVARENWRGTMTLLARIKVHSQQICGLAWSPDGSQFATGGNDNLCCLFVIDGLIDVESDLNPGFSKLSIANTTGDREQQPASPHAINPGDGASFSLPEFDSDSPDPSSALRCLPVGSEKHRWHHGAAVKAIAFCPWRQGLIATGGGSNDKCIHFYHANSGAALATISVAAQVTSLIWSQTRREIAATFGYAQPDHPYRIAVFSWPDCRQVAAVP